MPEVDAFVLRSFEWCHRGFQICWKGMGWSLVTGLLLAPVACLLLPPFRANASASVCCTTGLLLTGVFAVGYVLVFLARSILLTFFIAKFSLGQFMSVLLLAGFKVSLLMVLEGGWKVLPAACLAVLSCIVCLYIKSYDPFDRNKLLPPAAREVLFDPPDGPRRKEEG